MWKSKQCENKKRALIEERSEIGGGAITLAPAWTRRVPGVGRVFAFGASKGNEQRTRVCKITRCRYGLIILAAPPVERVQCVSSAK